jgi:hypothetical protein
MKLLLVTWVDPWTRSVSTVEKFIDAGQRLGHEIALFGPQSEYLPHFPYTTELDGVDLALFLIQVPLDFPDMPLLARLMDTIPADRRAVIDLWGRYNDTILIEHDFNHLEKLHGHLGWEWDEALRAISRTILQPGLEPLRPDVGSFLFHGFDPASVVKDYADAEEAAKAWREKHYGVLYVGSNWQRWHQVHNFLEQYGTMREAVGPACLIGWDWWERPDWAAEKGIASVDTNQNFLQQLEVEVRDGVTYDQLVGLLGEARFAPILHRPLFQKLGFVTGRSFETFYADTIPVLMLPLEFVEKIYGPAALTLVPEKGEVASLLTDALKHPVKYWDAVLKTRAHLAEHHSYDQRFQQLLAFIEQPGLAEVAR